MKIRGVDDEDVGCRKSRSGLRLSAKKNLARAMATMTGMEVSLRLFCSVILTTKGVMISLVK